MKLIRYLFDQFIDKLAAAIVARQGFDHWKKLNGKKIQRQKAIAIFNGTTVSDYGLYKKYLEQSNAN